MSEVTEALGYRVEIDPDKIVVRTDFRAFNRRERYTRAFLLIGALFVSCVWLVAQVRRESHEINGTASPLSLMTWIGSILSTALPITLAAHELCHRKDEVVWTKESVQVRAHFLTRATHTRIFVASDVGQVKYSSKDIPFLGPPSCIIFYVKGKRVVCSLGIQCIDAIRILASLRQMGFDVGGCPGAGDEK